MINLERRNTNAADDLFQVTTFLQKKCSRPFLLGNLDEKIQLHWRKVREVGGMDLVTTAVATSPGILLAYDCTKLAKFGGYTELNLTGIGLMVCYSELSLWGEKGQLLKASICFQTWHHFKKVSSMSWWQQ